MRKGSGLSSEVTALVGAICRGYAVREKVIRGAGEGADRRQLAVCLWLNGVVDEAVQVCPDDGTRAVVKRSLCEGAGFDRAGICFCGKNQFYRRKRDVKREIARQLHLI